MAFATSVALGLAFGAVYVALGMATTRVARRTEPRRGMALALGGLVVRLTLALGAVTLVLARTAVRPGPFVLAFLFVFSAQLAADLYRTARSGSFRSAPRPPTAS